MSEQRNTCSRCGFMGEPGPTWMAAVDIDHFFHLFCPKCAAAARALGGGG